MPEENNLSGWFCNESATLGDRIRHPLLWGGIDSDEPSGMTLRPRMMFQKLNKNVTSVILCSSFTISLLHKYRVPFSPKGEPKGSKVKCANSHSTFTQTQDIGFVNVMKEGCYVHLDYDRFNFFTSNLHHYPITNVCGV